MSWFTKLIGSASGNVAEVDANNQLRVVGNTDLTKLGHVGMAAIIDDGSFTGVQRSKRAWITEAGRQLVAQTNILWDDTFNATAQNTAKYKWLATTQTGAQAGGFLILNSSGLTTINTNCAYQSYKTFPIFGAFETRTVFSVQYASATAPVANCVVEIGLFQAALPGGAIPTDGAFFRWNAAGELRGVINYNGTETQTASMTLPSNNVSHDYMIISQADVTSFWVDRQLRGTITLLTDAPTLAQPFMAAEQPLTMRQYIGGSAPASATKLQVSDVFVSLVGPEQARSWGLAKGGFGHMGHQGQNGGTMGSTANYANNTNPVAAVPTNTTAALGTGLGGQFWETFSLAVTTDGIICSFQNPAGGVNQTPRNLIIYGVTIDSYIQTVLAGGPSNAQWSLAFGHTALSLATAETASFTSPSTKAPRRIALGQQAITAAQAVNTSLATVSRRFDGGPIVVAPGEFVAVAKKYVGTVGTSGTIAHIITFDAFFD